MNRLNRFLTAIFALLTMGMIGNPASAADEPRPSRDVPQVAAGDDLEALKDKAWTGMYVADMNSRYHQAMASRLSSWSTYVRAILMAASFLAVVFAARHATMLATRPKLDMFLKWASTITLGASIVMLFFPWGDQGARHFVIAQQWTSLRGEWSRLLSGLDNGTENVESAMRIEALLTYEKTISDMELTPPNEKLLEDCQDKVDRTYGVGKYSEDAA